MFILYVLAVRTTGKWWSWTADKMIPFQIYLLSPQDYLLVSWQRFTQSGFVRVRVYALREKNYPSLVATDQAKIVWILEDVWNGMPLERGLI